MFGCSGGFQRVPTGLVENHASPTVRDDNREPSRGAFFSIHHHDGFFATFFGGSPIIQNVFEPMPTIEMARSFKIGFQFSIICSDGQHDYPSAFFAIFELLSFRSEEHTSELQSPD